MRTKSLVLIIIALGCGLVASIGISEVLKRKSGDGVAETEPILVAVMDIDIGRKLDAENVKLEDWPKGKVPEGAMHTLEEVKDQYTRSRMYAGEPVLAAKLMNTKTSLPPIPEGYRALPVKVDLDTVIGLIQPGDLVDVMVFLRQGPDIPRTGTYTILRMTRVFAVNSQTDRATEQKGQEAAAKTVSLLVKPKQAERLTLATEMGKIRLALRRPTEEVPDDELVEKDLPAIFRGGDVLAIEKSETKKPAEPAPPITVVAVAPTPELAIAPPPSVWMMRIMSPTDIKDFNWANEADLPQETAASSAGTPAAQPPPPAVSAESDDADPPSD